MSKDITTSEKKGGGGELLADPRHIRGDAKTIAALLSCGVVSEDVVNTLLRKTILLCAKAADSNKPREVAALWRVMIAAARLGEESVKGPTVANQVNVTVNDERAIDRKRDIQTELEEIKLARERGNLIETKNVQAAFDILGRELAELAEKMAAVSPECRDMLIDTIISADRQIAELVPDETNNT